MTDRPAGSPPPEQPEQPDQSAPRASAVGPDEELVSALEQAAKAPTLLVATDFDGALAEFTVDPEDSEPAPGAMAALRSLAALPDTHVAVASGRDVRALRELTGVGSAERITLIGSHGAKRPARTSPRRTARAGATGPARRADRAGRRAHRPPPGRPARAQAGGRGRAHSRPARRRRGRGAGRGAGPRRGSPRRAVAAGQVGRRAVGLARRQGDGDCAAQRGRRVRRDLLHGDDVTDEDAFRAMDPDDGDVSVKVGHGETHAAYRVDSVSDVVETLEQLRDLRAQATGEDG